MCLYNCPLQPTQQSLPAEQPCALLVCWQGKLSSAPRLSLQLEECNDLLTVDVLAIGMEMLSLGTCPHLTSLNLAAPVLHSLDLRCVPHLGCL